ncbi:hypothetical protein BJ965_003924 [Streptomyces luteogriseus]|uniref:Uncharacterized protein n=1 Tax=Streptomyces luteogriseus TaxID=68233 RepID=A0A7W7DRH3_9ACTN|nr:hypothetical protein [Streptomyces luteogriseus]MBB4714042.1 hypothetical protein [Streptomyces luteogriseus]
MGKRQRRRQQNKTTKQQTRTVQRHLIPSAAAPLVEVVFHEDVSSQDKQTCLDYWAFTEPGTWTRKVSDIGPNAQVLRTVKASCHADLLTVICPDCAGPRSVYSRSDVTATRLWFPDVFPHEETVSPVKCQTCRDAEAAERAREAERASEEERERTARQVEAAGVWLREQADRDAPSSLPGLVGALTLLAMVDIMQRKQAESIGPLSNLNYTLTASADTDIEVIRTLHQDRWICPTTPATTSNFTFNEDGTARGVYITQVPWMLAPPLSDPAGRRELIALLHDMLWDRPDDLHEQIYKLEAGMAVDYLEGLLTRKYNEEPIPEHRLPDAYETFLNAREEGFTLGQLVAVAWSSAAGSVAWGQRTPGLKPGSVSAASVTNLERRIGYARDRRIDEYELPSWVPRPAIHSTALRLLQQQEAELGALSRFRALRQQVVSQDIEDLDYDQEDTPASGSDEALDAADFLQRLRSGAARESTDPPITYGLVTPDGSLEFHTEPPDKMRDKVSLAGSGYVDRVVLPDQARVHAYIAELVPASEENANPVADQMLRLMECFDGPFYGPLAFFGIGHSSRRPRSLDAEQQDMLRAAYEVAAARVK